VSAPVEEPALRVVRGYPDPEEVAALIAVLTALAQAGAATPGPGPSQTRSDRAPAGAHPGRYLSPTSWQAP
jgi:hypothetical protein